MPAPLTSNDNRLLRAWRRHELDDNACRQFESRLFFEPDLLAAARADQSLAEGVRLSHQSRPPRRIWRPDNPWQMLIAASVGALAVLPLAWREHAQPSLSANVEWVSIDVQRGSAARTPLLVQPRPATHLVALEVALPEASAGRFNLRLRGVEGSEQVLDIEDLHAIDGTLTLAFARDALAPGVYIIEIRRIGEQRLLSVDPPSFRYRPH